MKTEEVLDLINKINAKEGKLPSIPRLMQETGETSERIQKIYKHYFQMKKQERLMAKVGFNPNESVHSKKDVGYSIIRIIMGIVGSILVVCSVHFTYDFNKLGMDAFWAFMLSLSMILFTSFAFTVASVTGGKTAKVIYALWIIGVSYSIFTAIAGQYNDFRYYVGKDDSVTVEQRNTLLGAQLSTLQEKQKQLLHWRIEESEYTANPDLKTENPSTWRTIQNGVKDLKETETEIINIQNKLYTLTESNVEENKTIYHWLGKILHINPDIIQFIVLVFPSVFLDLCATICLKFAFIRKNT